MSDTLFWISLASGLLVLAGISLFKFTHSGAEAPSHDVQDLPADRP